MQSFPKATQDLSFIQLNKELQIEDLILPKGMALPLLTESLEEKIQKNELDFGTKELTTGILFLYGADPNFPHRDLYRQMIQQVQPVYGLIYSNLETMPFKSLLMSLGLLNLQLQEKGIYLLAAEACNELIKQGEDYTSLALELLEKEDPSWGVSYHKGYLYYQKEDYSKALEAWKSMLQQNPPEEITAEILSHMALAEKKKDYLLGRELLFKERHEEARQMLKSLLPDFPHWYELHFYYGLSLRFLQEYREALSTFYGLLHQRRDDLHLYNELAICHLFLGEADKAKRLLEEGLKLADHPDLRLNLAISLYELGEKHEALEQLERAQGLAPDDELIQAWKEQMRKDDE